jgi:hypothetical protein
MDASMRMSVGVFVLCVSGIAIDVDIELHSTEIRPDHTRGTDAVSIHRQLLKFRSQIFQVQSEVQQSADRHIAADTGEAIEVERPHTRKYYHAGKW